MKRLHPTPEEHAALLVRKLEDAIRAGKSGARGMSFKAWQEVARVEIANAIRDVQARQERDEQLIRRLILGVVAAVSTVGFWGGVVAFDRSMTKMALGIGLVVGALALLFATEWWLRGSIRRGRAKSRNAGLQRIATLERQIKQMERIKEKKLEALKKDVEEA